MDAAALNYTLRQPLGVVGLISPWNLPLYLLSWKIAPAIAAGNTCVAKPSELTPLTANRLAELSLEAGIPPGVINIVHGYGNKAGRALTCHDDVAAISFTGGTVTGAAVAANAAPRFKKLSLELGGKNPNLIFADADLDDAIATSIRSSFWNQGEICLCGSRIFVERSIHDEFVTRFAAATKKLRIGDPLDESTDVGALISDAHLQKVMGYIDLADEGRRHDRRRRPSRRTPRLLRRANHHHRTRNRLPRPAGRDLRPRRHHHAVRQRRRSGRLRQLHPLRPLRHRLDPRPLPRSPRRRRTRRRHHLDQLLAPPRPPRPLRRHERKRRGKRRRLRIAQLLHGSEECVRENLKPINHRDTEVHRASLCVLCVSVVIRF